MYGMSAERAEFPAELTRLKLLIQKFDELWTTYEKKYVYELMVIEQDARRFVIESINLEGALMMLAKGKTKDSDQFDQQREAMLQLICQINAIANVEGKGRDDFQWALMPTAETILSVKTNSVEYSKAVVELADKVKTSFNAYRVLMQKYQKNIEVVDPELKNNKELVQVLTLLEDSWDLAKGQIGSEDRIQQLNEFSKLIWATCDEFKEFREQVEFKLP